MNAEVLYFLVMGVTGVETERDSCITKGEGPRTDSERRKMTAYALIIIAAVAFGVYFNTLFNGFVYDDGDQVLDNPWIKDASHIPDIFSKSVWSFRKETVVSNYYRPMMHIAYLIDYQVFGLRPWGFHLVNVLMHAAVSILVFSVARIFAKRGSEVVLLSGPFIAALLFAVHPIHTEVVAWVAALPELSFTFFFLLSFCLYVRSNGVLGIVYVLSVGSFFVSVLCKETALVLPVVLIAYDFAFGKGEVRGSQLLKRHFAYGVIVIIYLVLRVNALGGLAPQPAHTQLSPYGYVINVFPLFTKYMEKQLLPVNLNAFHVFHPVESVLEPKWLLSLAAFALFVSGAVIGFRRNRIVFFFLTLAAVPLFPVLYIPGLGENVFAERYLYLPSVGLAVLTALLAVWVKGRASGGGAIVSICLAAVFVLYCTGTVSRNMDWKNDYLLFSDTVGKSPDGVLPRINFGNALSERGRIDDALGQYEMALKMEPDSPEALNNIGDVYRDKGLIDRAIEYYHSALAFAPDSAGIHNNLGNAYYDKGWIDKATEQFLIAVRLNPDYAQAYNNLGSAYYDKGRTEEAIEQYKRALRLNPDLAEAYNNLGNVFRGKGWADRAMREYLNALKVKPGYADSHYNMGNIYVGKGLTDKAVEEYQLAVKYKPDFADAHYNLGNAYYEKGRIGEAIEQYKRTIALRPDDAEAHYNLGSAYLTTGQQAEARREFAAAQRIKPGLAAGRGPFAK